ncbi:flavodoxin family protein, partial [Thermodesulfobacteriota bacterium]
GIKTCDGIVLGCPIYMYRISGQMKLFVDRLYSLYSPRAESREYSSQVPPGKTFALVISQGAADPDQYKRSVRWLAGMGGTGLGMEEAGKIIHTNGNTSPAAEDEKLLKEAREIGRRLLKK